MPFQDSTRRREKKKKKKVRRDGRSGKDLRTIITLQGLLDEMVMNDWDRVNKFSSCKHNLVINKNIVVFQDQILCGCVHDTTHDS